jgi:hypothetical protein
MARRFTLREAENLLPQVSALIQDAVALKAQCQEAENSIEALSRKVMLCGGMIVNRERAQAVRRRRDDTLEKLKATVESIHQTGCLVKDLDKGLVDFPTLFRGQEVYLCWKMDEPEIRFWHRVEDGFAGRQQIDQEFLDNHRGDPLT